MASPTPSVVVVLLLLAAAAAAQDSMNQGVLQPPPNQGVLQPPPAPAVPPTAPPNGLVSFTGGKGYYKKMAREFVASHNKVRSAHGEAPFVWDNRLARYARRWTDRLREQCVIVHSMGPYGENMFWGTGWDWKAADAVRSWAHESFFYDPAENSCLPDHTCGHFTQIVWNDTVRVGCARVECSAGGVLITCNYDPPGNWLGERPF